MAPTTCPGLPFVAFALLASGTAAASPQPQPPSTLISFGFDMPTFLSHSDMTWDWEIHANASELDFQYTRHEQLCAQRASDPNYRLLGHVGCSSNISECLKSAVAACDANEWCAAIQRNTSSSSNEFTLCSTAFPLEPCGEGVTWTKSPYDRAPVTFDQAGWVGNGLLGLQFRTTQAFAGAPFGSALRIDIGRRDVWDTRAPGSPYSQGSALLDRPRLPIGYWTLTPVGAVLRGAMRLSVADAELLVHIDTEAGSIDLVLLAPAGQVLQDVASSPLIVSVNATPGEAAVIASLVFVPLQAASQVLPWPPGYVPNPPAACNVTAVQGVCTQELLGGGDFATAWQVAATPQPAPGMASAALVATVVNLALNNETGSGPVAREQVSLAVSTGFSEFRSAHLRWWSSFWNSSAVSLPDALLEGFYVLQLFKLGSALGGSGNLSVATPASHLPLDLFGPWYTHSRWGLMWTDMNLELTYLPLLAANQPALSSTLVEWMTARRAALEQNAAPFSRDSMAIGGAVSADLFTEPGVAAPPSTVGCLPWLAHMSWLHARVVSNDTLMRLDVYPLLRGAINNYLHMLRRDANGTLHLPVTSSPEYPQRGPDTSFDLALLLWGATELLSLASRFNISEPLAANYSDVVAHLTPLPTDSFGIMVASNVSFSIPHRHWSHLFAIWPLRTLDWRTANETVRELIATSVDHYSNLTCRQWLPQFAQDGKPAGGHYVWECPNGFTGVGVAAYSLHMGRADAAVGNLTAELGTLMPPNTMYGEENESPNIESALSVAYVLHEFLLQTDPLDVDGVSTLRVFPAMPANWSDCAFWRLSARGVLVSASRLSNATQWVHVQGSVTAEPSAGLVLVISGLVDGAQLDVRTTPAGLNWTQVGPATLLLPFLAPDQEVLVWAAAQPPPTPPVLLPVQNDANLHNGWGWHSPPAGPQCSSAPFVDIRTVLPDLFTPPMTFAPAGPGRRVLETTPGWSSDAYWALYLPPEWVNTSAPLPLIVELAGNGPWESPYGDASLGRPEGSNLGYGITAGHGALWASVPMLTDDGAYVESWWWGCPAVAPFTGNPPSTTGEDSGHCITTCNVSAAVRFIVDTVASVVSRFNADPTRVVIAGFSRGAVGVNYLGLYNDEIASIWRASIAYAHYDGQPMDAKNPYPNPGPPQSYDRMRRLWPRPQYIVAEDSGAINMTKPYIEASGVPVNATYAETGYCNHNDAWVLRPSPARDALRAWFWSVVGL